MMKNTGLAVRIFCLYTLLSMALAGFAVAETGLSIVPDRADHLYSIGDTVTFTLSFDAPSGARLEYIVSEDGETVLDEGELPLDGGQATVRAALSRPGFLRVNATLYTATDTLRRMSACGFDPKLIRPTNSLPEDFDRFWRNGRAELLRIPPDPVLERREDPENTESALYHLSLANVEGARVYGWLRVPRGEGPFPAVLCVPGAGVGALGSRPQYARAGFVSLVIEVHGIGIDREESFYDRVEHEPLRAYFHLGKENPHHYYYRRVILGCIRALDYLCSRDDVDTSRVAIAGSSQGGALSLLTAGLDKRIKALTANVPAMCDHTGALHGRPSGWPRLLNYGDRERIIATSGYYDAALNAGLIEVPALVAVGFVDRTCAPTTVYAAYNNLGGYKEIDNFTDMGHAYGPGWADKSVRWLMDALNGKIGGE